MNEWLTLDDILRIEGGDPLGGDALLVRVEVVQVALGGHQAQAPGQGDEQQREPHLVRRAHLETEIVSRSKNIDNLVSKMKATPLALSRC